MPKTPHPIPPSPGVSNTYIDTLTDGRQYSCFNITLIHRSDLSTVVKRIIQHLLREAEPRPRTLISIPTIRRHLDRRVRDLDRR